MGAEGWLGLHIELLGVAMQFFVAVFCLMNPSLSAGELGLSLSYSMLITQSVGWMLTEVAKLENDFVAIERIKEYCEIATEAAQVVQMQFLDFLFVTHVKDKDA